MLILILLVYRIYGRLVKSSFFRLCKFSALRIIRVKVGECYAEGWNYETKLDVMPPQYYETLPKYLIICFFWVIGILQSYGEVESTHDLLFRKVSSRQPR